MNKKPDVKDSNPKDSVGIKKIPLSTVSAAVMCEIGSAINPGRPFSSIPYIPCFEIGLAMLEGALKYGRHNYRAVGVRASVYYDASMRHLTAYLMGEDIDPDSGLSHIIKAMACFMVLRDAQYQNLCEDDRPPRVPESITFEWLKEKPYAEPKTILEWYDCFMPHLLAYWEGIDHDPKSGNHNIIKVLEYLCKMREMQLKNKCRDDRVFKGPKNWIYDYNKIAKKMIEKVECPVGSWTEKNKEERLKRLGGKK